MTLGEYLKRFGNNHDFMTDNLVIVLEDKNGILTTVDNEKIFKHEYDKYKLTQVNFNELYARHELRIKESENGQTADI